MVNGNGHILMTVRGEEFSCGIISPNLSRCIPYRTKTGPCQLRLDHLPRILTFLVHLLLQVLGNQNQVPEMSDGEVGLVRNQGVTEEVVDDSLDVVHVVGAWEVVYHHEKELHSDFPPNLATLGVPLVTDIRHNSFDHYWGTSLLGNKAIFFEDPICLLEKTECTEI